jgi:uncharacterized protein with FMN-binding domain
MRKFLVVILLTAAALIPLLRYQPSHPAALPTQPAPVASSAPPSPSSAQPGGNAVVDGSTVDTEFGPYQVQVTFNGTKISDVRIITEPDDRHSQRIANNAAPTLRQEALQAQSARIDTVSGATATSEAYAQSLQAALDTRGH